MSGRYNVSKELSKKQRSEVFKILHQYMACVYIERPGNTSLVEHKIEMVEDGPIRSK